MNIALEVEQEMKRVPLELIVGGKNPRKHFDTGEMAELTESIRVRGVIQPVTLRPVEDGKFAIVAGERRVIAARNVYGDTGAIPAVIAEITEDEADDIALIENTVRADMSAAEEAQAAARILERNKGDRTETARLLGWEIGKLNRRLALMNLVAPVMDSLIERKILLGHAELLSAAPQDKQTAVLEKILEHKLSVAFVKERLMKAATDFKGAIFDRAKCGCTTCQYNSTVQNTLFSESIDEGCCTNADCFAAKTREHIEAIRTELAEEFQTARILALGDKGFTNVAVEEIGEEQHQACLGCAYYGATVSAIPGSEGEVVKGVCVDLLCYQKHVAERVKAKKALEEATTEQKNTAPPKAEGKTGNKGVSGSGATEKPGLKKAKAAALGPKVVEYRRTVWENAAKKELAANPEKSRAFILDLLLTGDARLVDAEKLKAIYGKIAGEAYPEVNRYDSSKRAGHPEKPFALDTEKQNKLFAAAAVSAVSNKEFGDLRLQGLLTFLDTDLTNHYTLDANFMNLLTKAEIESVSVGLGLDGLVTDWKKVIGGKKNEAIKAIFAVPFEFAGAVPAILAY